ncbi:MAG: UDP-N-acetylglucosamine--N-acetylmuramyl-(pentapeptide) pyrophosphoryl-undecaprenol N-acetylglucosamine transferase [Bacteroidia bacterium]|nr:UDP-N-acetylglucosamine--N-acetylmuramyl-(pentapeptide) pyrophosphoryl-undecaprenol N-acetylglucosamine transferase [Bacteroidia bacterium]
MPEGTNDAWHGNVRVVDFMTTSQLQQVFAECEWIIARSGYSTVMDMAALGTKALFIPTPGQPEQMHLADRLTRQGIAYSAQQHDFKLDDALARAKLYSGFHSPPVNEHLLRQILLNFMHENLS